MNNTIRILAEFCTRYPFEEKILFVPSYHIGRQIGENLTRQGTPWINLRFTTTSGFAQERVNQDLTSKKIRYITHQERHIIIEQIFNVSSSPGGYFERAADTPGIISCLAQAVHELRMAGFTHDTIEPGAFIVPEKGAELVWLLQSYESYLSEKKRIDHPGLLAMAIEKLKHGKGASKDSLYMLLLDFPLSLLEKELIHCAGTEDIIVVEHTFPNGLRLPKRFFPFTSKRTEVSLKPTRNIELLPWIFDSGNSPKPFDDDSVSLFRAMGESNEIREVFRRILKKGIPFDDVEMITATTDPYFQFIYEISLTLDIPATFMGGLPLSCTLPARALNLYLRWQIEDFQDGSLKQLFAGGLLDLTHPDVEGEKPGDRKAVALIREAAIGWGRERYASRLQDLQNSLEKLAAKCREKGEEERAERKERRVKHVFWLKSFCLNLLETAPRADSNGKIQMADLYEGALKFVRNFCRQQSA